MGRPSYRCHECDDWKPAPICPDCGIPCALYVPSRAAKMRPRKSLPNHVKEMKR